MAKAKKVKQAWPTVIYVARIPDDNDTYWLNVRESLGELDAGWAIDGQVAIYELKQVGAKSTLVTFVPD